MQNLNKKGKSSINVRELGFNQNNNFMGRVGGGG